MSTPQSRGTNTSWRSSDRASGSTLSEAGHEQAHGPGDPTALSRGQEQGFHPLEPLAKQEIHIVTAISKPKLTIRRHILPDVFWLCFAR